MSQTSFSAFDLSGMFDHTQLKIWQRSQALSLAVDRALEQRTKRGPAGLASQLSRACASIPANIAEGAGCQSSSQTSHFLDVAIGSSSETENHLDRAGALEVLPIETSSSFVSEVREIRRMIAGFKKWVLHNPR